MTRCTRRLAALAAAFGLSITTLVLADEMIQRVESRPGVTQAFLLLRPRAAPLASVILFAGGHGRLRLSERGIGWGKGNFLVRNRGRFAEEGFLVAVPDAPSDRMSDEGMDFRTSASNARDVAAVIAFLRKEAKAPVWLVGTSAGTLSAANAAVRLSSGGADGLVLTSTILRSSRMIPGSVLDLPLDAVKVATLVVHHKQDSCPATPYGDVANLVKRLGNAPKIELISFEGGDEPRSQPCEAMSHHGYIGQDAEVVGAISRWIRRFASSK